tara:strand:- start:402 stop:554 length:153 start_codon:yes stop_codon:yes gene_type:complete
MDPQLYSLLRIVEGTIDDVCIDGVVSTFMSACRVIIDLGDGSSMSAASSK